MINRAEILIPEMEFVAAVEAARGSGVEAILYDLDDTITEAHGVYVDYLATFKNQLNANLSEEIDRGQLYKDIYRLNIEAGEVIGVTKNRWDWLAQQLVDKYGTSNAEVIFRSRQVLDRIYEVIPILKPGAVEVLSGFQRQHFLQGVVSHNPKENLDNKLLWTNIQKYFNHVEPVETKIKGPQAWENGAAGLELTTKQVIVVGNSIRGDMVSAYEAGVDHRIWLDVENDWEVFKNGDLPEGTATIQSLAELPSAIIKLCA